MHEDNKGKKCNNNYIKEKRDNEVQLKGTNVKK